MNRPYRVQLSYKAASDEFPTEAQVAVPGGYLDVEGWRLTYDPRNDKPWTVWEPEADGVRDVWEAHATYAGALQDLTECVVQYAGK